MYFVRNRSLFIEKKTHPGFANEPRYEHVPTLLGRTFFV